MSEETAVATMDSGIDLGGGGDTGGSSESTALTTTSHESTDLAINDATDGTGEGTEGQELAVAGKDGRQTTNQALEPIKQSDPATYRQVNKALAIEQRLRSEFPTGNPFEAIKTLRGIENAVNKLGGLNAIHSELADIETLDLWYAAGDPRMLDKMTESDEGKAAFLKMIPLAISKLARIAPNFYTRYMAAVIADDLVKNRVDMTVQRLRDTIPVENTLALAELAKMDKYLKRVEDFGQLQPEVFENPKETPQNQQLQQRQRELDQERERLLADRWNDVTHKIRNQILSAQWKKQTAGMKVTPADQEDIITRYSLRTNLAIAGDQNSPVSIVLDPSKNNRFYEDGRRFFGAKDQEGWLRYVTAAYNTEAPRVLAAELARRGYKAQTKTAPANSTQTAVKTVPAAQGFTRITQRPNPNDIKLGPNGTSSEMRLQGKYILKNGSKVHYVAPGR